MIQKDPENRADSKKLIQIFEINDAKCLIEKEKLD